MQTRLTFDGANDRKLVVTLEQVKNGKRDTSTFVYEHTPPASTSSSR